MRRGHGPSNQIGRPRAAGIFWKGQRETKRPQDSNRPQRSVPSTGFAHRHTEPEGRFTSPGAGWLRECAGPSQAEAAVSAYGSPAVMEQESYKVVSAPAVEVRITSPFTSFVSEKRFNRSITVSELK
eukprot:g16157.t1